MIDYCFVAHVDLAALDKRRYRHDDGEIFHVALEIIRHRDHGPFAVAYQHHLGCTIEQAGVSLGNVKAAKCVRSGADADCEAGGEDSNKQSHR